MRDTQVKTWRTTQWNTQRRLDIHIAHEVTCEASKSEWEATGRCWITEGKQDLAASSIGMVGRFMYPAGAHGSISMRQRRQ